MSDSKIVNHKFEDEVAGLKCTNADEHTVTLKCAATGWLFLSAEDIDALYEYRKDNME